MIRRDAGGPGERPDDRRWRRNVWVADPEVDYVDAAGSCFALLAIDLDKQVRRQLGQSPGYRKFFEDYRPSSARIRSA
jgi:hypothetical protein